MTVRHAPGVACPPAAKEQGRSCPPTDNFSSAVMEIPTSCQSWEQLMRDGTDESRAILASILAEQCVDEKSRNRFFSDLAARHTTAPPASAEDAWEAARQVVKEAQDELLCLGREADPDQFLELARVQRPTSLEYCIPTDQREGLLGDGAGWSADVLKKLDQAVVTAYLEGYGGTVDTTNRIGITWAADMAEVQPVLEHSPSALRNRLGLADWEHEKYGILLAYSRAEIVDNVRVPRAFDGIEMPAFTLVEDCEATVGRTKPLIGDHANGLSEVIHRGHKVQPTRFGTILLNE